MRKSEYPDFLEIARVFQLVLHPAGTDAAASGPLHRLALDVLTRPEEERLFRGTLNDTDMVDFFTEIS